MTGPPAAQPANQVAAAAGVARQPKTTLKLSSRVKIVNNSSNTSGCIRRRDAEFFLAAGRAVYAGRDPATGRDHLRLVETHPTNRADALEAACARDQLQIERGGLLGVKPFDGNKVTLHGVCWAGCILRISGARRMLQSGTG